MNPLIWLNYLVGPRRVYIVLFIIKDIFVCSMCLAALGLGIFVKCRRL